VIEEIKPEQILPVHIGRRDFSAIRQHLANRK